MLDKTNYDIYLQALLSNMSPDENPIDHIPLMLREVYDKIKVKDAERQVLVLEKIALTDVTSVTSICGDTGLPLSSIQYAKDKLLDKEWIGVKSTRSTGRGPRDEIFFELTIDGWVAFTIIQFYQLDWQNSENPDFFKPALDNAFTALERHGFFNSDILKSIPILTRDLETEYGAQKTTWISFHFIAACSQYSGVTLNFLFADELISRIYNESETSVVIFEKLLANQLIFYVFYDNEGKPEGVELLHKHPQLYQKMQSSAKEQAVVLLMLAKSLKKL